MTVQQQINLTQSFKRFLKPTRAITAAISLALFLPVAQAGETKSSALCQQAPLSYQAHNLAKPNKNAKKQAFFSDIIPQVHKANGKIVEQRKQLLDAYYNHLQHQSLASNELSQVQNLAAQYRVKAAWPEAAAEQQKWLVELLSRVDIIPASLVVAQAANESAWGKSRFATEGNNYFGQWCYKKGCGLVPKQRSQGAKHEVAVFDDMQASVASYLRNLNSHYAYQGLRQARAQLRCQHQAITGIALAPSLMSYSEKGQAYIDTLISMIKYNKLNQLD